MMLAVVVPETRQMIILMRVTDGIPGSGVLVVTAMMGVAVGVAMLRVSMVMGVVTDHACSMGDSVVGEVTVAVALWVALRASIAFTTARSAWFWVAKRRKTK